MQHSTPSQGRLLFVKESASGQGHEVHYLSLLLEALKAQQCRHLVLQHQGLSSLLLQLDPLMGEQRL